MISRFCAWTGQDTGSTVPGTTCTSRLQAQRCAEMPSKIWLTRWPLVEWNRASARVDYDLDPGWRPVGYLTQCQLDVSLCASSINLSPASRSVASQVPHLRGSKTSEVSYSVSSSSSVNSIGKVRNGHRLESEIVGNTGKVGLLQPGAGLRS